MHSPATTHDLHACLNAALNLPAEYGGRLSSHSPMALQALHELGATHEQMCRFAATYSLRFSSLRGDQSTHLLQPASLANWQQHLGDFSALPGLLSHFAHQVQLHGAQLATSAALPALWPGLAAAAFHGPIRLAHALRSGHPLEAAAALAYWAARWQGTSSVGVHVAADVSVHNWLEAVDTAAQQWLAPAGSGMIAGRMRAACATSPAWAELAANLPTIGVSWPTLSRWAAQLYADTGNFTVLHMVTGSRALAQLWPMLEQAPDALAQALSQALQAFAAAAFAAAPTPRTPFNTRPLTWDELIAHACESADDHCIKLVHSAWLLNAADPYPSYGQAASKAVELDRLGRV